jgi:hypothetical protein
LPAVGEGRGLFRKKEGRRRRSKERRKRDRVAVRGRSWKSRQPS